MPSIYISGRKDWVQDWTPQAGSRRSGRGQGQKPRHRIKSSLPEFRIFPCFVLVRLTQLPSLVHLFSFHVWLTRVACVILLPQCVIKESFPYVVGKRGERKERGSLCRGICKSVCLSPYTTRTGAINYSISVQSDFVLPSNLNPSRDMRWNPSSFDTARRHNY